MVRNEVKRVLEGWCYRPGFYVSVDGQFGSTGKGVINGVVGEVLWRRFNNIVSNAGPNSGHTSFYDDEQIILKQLPTSAAHASKEIKKDQMGKHFPHPKIIMSGGVVINGPLLHAEKTKHADNLEMWVHPAAAMISPENVEEDKITVNEIASTGQGVGPAIAGKLSRSLGLENVYGMPSDFDFDKRPVIGQYQTSFFEVSQGYSLGINSGFYPHVTSRECTVAQALADAGVSPKHFVGSIMTVRTFPIRVGSTENTSGPGYPDQEETDWKKLGVTPETTTVTGRIRRVFTWSELQYISALRANTPDIVFLNFCNYLEPGTVEEFVRQNILRPYHELFGKLPIVLTGYGPKSEDVYLYEE